MTETCKIINGTSPPIIEKKLYYEKIHKTRNFQEISNENRKTAT